MAKNFGAIPGLSRSPRIGAGVAVVIVAWLLIPEPKPRYRPGQEPDREEKDQA